MISGATNQFNIIFVWKFMSFDSLLYASEHGLYHNLYVQIHCSAFFAFSNAFVSFIQLILFYQQIVTYMNFSQNIMLGALVVKLTNAFIWECKKCSTADLDAHLWYEPCSDMRIYMHITTFFIAFIIIILYFWSCQVTLLPSRFCKFVPLFFWKIEIQTSLIGCEKKLLAVLF